MVKFINIIVVFFLILNYCFSQNQPDLIENSLKMVDIGHFLGEPGDPKLGFGFYTNNIVADSLKYNLLLARQLQFYQIWHVLPHSSSDKAGIRIGDTLIALNGKPIKYIYSWGYNIADYYIQENKAYDTVYLSILKNGKPVEIAVKLYPRTIVEQQFYDPGLGEVRKDTWLQKQIKDFHLEDSVREIQRNMLWVANTDFCKAPFAERHNPWRLNAVTYLHHYPLRVGAYSRMIVNDIWNGYEKKSISGILKAAAKHWDVPANDIEIIDKPKTINDLNEFLDEVQTDLDSAYNPLLSKFSDKANGFNNLIVFLGELLNRGEGAEKAIVDNFRLADAVNLSKLVSAAQRLSVLIDEKWLTDFTDSIQKGTNKPLNIEGVDGDVIAYWENAQGRCIIGGPGNNRYYGNFSVIIDLGGNDIYELPQAKYASYRFIADLGGDDTYMNTGMGQGAGVGCIDILFDAKGDDTYRSTIWSQGAGLLGIGILADYSGNDIYSSHLCSQGAGFVGFGLLFDKEGNDNYIAASYSQGFGYCKGFGLLMDQNGNDSYKAGQDIFDSRDQPKRAFQSMSQGFGYGFRPWSTGVSADGGIGILTDYNGNDIYNGDYFSQGSSYWLGLGILYDKHGCDRYTAGQYSQGAGIHLSFGALLDDEGDDMYDSYSRHQQGASHDLSSGCLEDYQGNDTYRGYEVSQGSAQYVGFAYLLDSNGDDMYFIKEANKDESQGGGNYIIPRKAGSLGLLIDLGNGKDVYTDTRVVPGKPVLKGDKGIIFDDGNGK